MCLICSILFAILNAIFLNYDEVDKVDKAVLEHAKSIGDSDQSNYSIILCKTSR